MTAPERVRFDFSGMHVLVTGGSSGIGAGIARGFEAAGRITSMRAFWSPDTIYRE